MDFMFVGLWNELCFHFIFHHLCVYMVLCVCACASARAPSMVPHKIYNNSLKRFRKQHHTRQNKLWNELTICFCVFLRLYHRVQTKWEAADESNGIKRKKTHTIQYTYTCTSKNTMFVYTCSPYKTHAYISLIFFCTMNEFLFIDFAKVHTYFLCVVFIVGIAHVCIFATAAFSIFSI